MEDLFVQHGLIIPAEELEEEASRSGGPGGQNVNKRSTRVGLRWNVLSSIALSEVWRARLLQKLPLTQDGVLLIVVDTTRSQLQNRVEARERLAQRVREALVVPRRRVATRPTRASQERRLEEKRRAGSRKQGRGGGWE